MSRWSLSFIFFWAGGRKLIAPSTFAVSIDNYRILPTVLTEPLAVAVSLIELILALLLILRPRDHRPPLAAMLLSCVFLAFNSSALIRGIDLECGCFGATSGRVGLTSLSINLLMLGASFYLTAQLQKVKDVTKALVIGGAVIGLMTLTAIGMSDRQLTYQPVSLVEQTSPKPTASPPYRDLREAGQPTVKFFPEALELGEVKLGESIRRTVLITNHMPTALTVTAIGLGCHCTKVWLPSRTLPPGVPSEMIVKYTAGPQTGAFELGIGLKTAELTNPLHYSLTVSVPKSHGSK